MVDCHAPVAFAARDPSETLVPEFCCDAQGAAHLTAWYCAILAGDDP